MFLIFPLPACGMDCEGMGTFGDGEGYFGTFPHVTLVEGFEEKRLFVWEKRLFLLIQI